MVNGCVVYLLTGSEEEEFEDKAGIGYSDSQYYKVSAIHNDIEACQSNLL